MDRWVTEGLGDVLGTERNTEVNQAKPQNIQSTMDYLKENELADKHIKDIVLDILEEMRKMEMDRLKECGWDKSTSSNMLDIRDTVSRLKHVPDKSSFEIIRKSTSKYMSSDSKVCAILDQIKDKSYNEINKKEYDKLVIATILSDLKEVKELIEKNQR